MAYCNVMGTKKISFLLIVVIILAVSCLSGPETIPPEAEQPPQTQVQTPAPAPSPEVVVVQPPAEPVFDPATISRAQRDATIDEIQQFIINLNQIIRNRNYNSWRTALSQEYYDRISSPEFLQEISDRPIMRNQRIVLRTPQDYFNNIVVPARASNRVDEHVDDIEYISRDRVKAYTIDPHGERVLLYDLEKIENSWKIIN